MSPIRSNKKIIKKRPEKPKSFIRSLLPSTKGSYIVTAVIVLAAFAAITYLFLPIPGSVLVRSEIPFTTEYVNDNSIELGEEQVRTIGKTGTKETTYSIRRTLSGKELSRSNVKEEVVNSPEAKTVAKGTRKYQFMWCSNGSYRHYTSEQFKDPYTGFTHKSPDYCAQNGQGTMTNIADSAPPAAQTRTVYQPTYRSSLPTYTTCRDTSYFNSYSSSFSCTSY